MAIFAVIATTDNQKLGPSLAKNFPENYIQINTQSWLVSFDGTSQELSEKLGVTDGSHGSAVIVSISGYYGRASTTVWEWMKAKLESGKDG